MTEQWRDVPGFLGKYQVSDLGHVRSWAQPNGNCPIPSTPRILKSTRNYKGYHVVTLSDWAGSKKQYRVHCLVLTAFKGDRPPGHQGAHQDDDKDNNELANLAWKTPGENIRDRSRNGRTAKGEKHGAYRHGRHVGTHWRYDPPKFVGSPAIR
ncbi:NUMOD4 domain-containing protein [Mycobacterium paragordonae]|uniref:NUMOD4 domain-containing protein n=1 Tax=Mycobacterium paragordonae TaxID=1389713 RepID=UPI00351ACE0E